MKTHNDHDFFRDFLLKRKIKLLATLLVLIFSLSAQTGNSKSTGAVNPSQEKIISAKTAKKAKYDLIPLPFEKNGEYLKFRITYLGVTGGFAEMKVLAPDSPSDPYINIELKAWTTPFVDRIYKLNMTLTSRGERPSGHTVRYFEDRIEKKSHRQQQLEITEINTTNGSYQIDYEKGKGKDNLEPRSTYYSWEPAYDVLSSFYTTRKLKDLTSTVVFPTFFQSKKYFTKVEILERTTIRTDFGKIPCIVVKPVMDFPGLFANDGDIIIYLSDDAYRVPLLMESEVLVGAFKAKLEVWKKSE